MQNTVYSVLVMRVLDIVLQWADTWGMQVGIDFCNKIEGYRLTVGGYSGAEVGNDIGSESDGYRLQWENTRGMAVGTDLCGESDRYRLTLGGYSGMQVGIDIGNESDSYCLTVIGYSGDVGRAY